MDHAAPSLDISLDAASRDAAPPQHAHAAHAHRVAAAPATTFFGSALAQGIGGRFTIAAVVAALLWITIMWGLA